MLVVQAPGVLPGGLLSMCDRTGRWGMASYPHLVRIVGHDVPHDDIQDVGQRHAGPKILLAGVIVIRVAVRFFNADCRAHLALTFPSVDDEKMG